MTTRYKSRDLRKLAVLWSAVDTGEVTLPDDITDLRTAHARLTEQARAITAPDGLGTQADLVDVVTAAALNGTAIPDLDAVAHGFARRTAAENLAAAVRATIDALEDKLTGAVYGAAEQIVTDHLAPVHAEIVNDLRRVAAVLAGHDLDPASLLGAAQKVREARLELDVIVNRYASVRAIYGALGPSLDVHLDVDGRFSEMQNYADIVGHNDPIGAKTPPWPTDNPVNRLLWLLGHGAQLWCPTAEQRDTAFRESYPDSPAVKGYNPVAVAVGS